MTRFLNISTDNTLGGLSPSDEFVASQKAIKEYVDNNSSNVQVDNLTINTNASDEIQTIAAINQNSGILKFWKGSKVEYDNLPSHDPDTQYTVTGDNTAGMMPTGSIIPFAGTNIPDGYLLCDGSAISRTTYADLFAVIGTVYGTGDGSTTFNLPNCMNRFIRQYWNSTSNIGFTTNGELPNITGKIWGDGYNDGARANPIFWGYTGAFQDGIEESATNIAAHAFGAAYKQRSWINFDASRSSSVYGAGSGTNVIPSSITMQFCIKF